jgi:hypothetical protein
MEEHDELESQSIEEALAKLAAGQEDEEEPRLFTAILGLGSNLGDRVRNLERALDHLKHAVRLERLSSVYETEPLGDRELPAEGGRGARPGA